MVHDIDKIYREHASTVYKFLYTKTQNADWVGELTQETFYRAMNSLNRYDGSYNNRRRGTTLTGRTKNENYESTASIERACKRGFISA